MAPVLVIDSLRVAENGVPPTAYEVTEIPVVTAIVVAPAVTLPVTVEPVAD
jgi:hypothetical protein